MILFAIFTLFHREETWGPWSAGGGYAGRDGGPHRDNMDQSARLVMTVRCAAPGSHSSPDAGLPTQCLPEPALRSWVIQAWF